MYRDRYAQRARLFGEASRARLFVRECTRVRVVAVEGSTEKGAAWMSPPLVLRGAVRQRADERHWQVVVDAVAEDRCHLDRVRAGDTGTHREQQSERGGDDGAEFPDREPPDRCLTPRHDPERIGAAISRSNCRERRRIAQAPHHCTLQHVRALVAESGVAPRKEGLEDRHEHVCPRRSRARS
jgi:hypothetical protein